MTTLKTLNDNLVSGHKFSSESGSFDRLGSGSEKAAVRSDIHNVLTIDVEDYFHVQAFADVISAHDWRNFPSRVEQNTSKLLDMLAQRDVTATFFILGWVAERFPALVSRIFNAGHEIGCHSYAHRMVASFDPNGFRDDVRRAKSILEDRLGAPIKSYRAPSYSITAQTLWALDILLEEGFESDSSIFPVVHDHYGIPNAPRFPHVKSLPRGGEINEFPPSTVRLFGVNVPVAGGGYLRLMPYTVTAWAIRHIHRKDRQPAMVYVHPWEMDPDQPKISAAWRSRFRHYQNLDTTEEKLGRLLDEFCWGPMERVLSECLPEANSQREVAHGD